MTAWGKTGRVTLVNLPLFQQAVCVESPGSLTPEWVGTVADNGRISRQGWSAAVRTGPLADLPTRDAAILWVLRRVDPALWRQERGEVWTTRINRLTPSERRRHPGTAPEAWQHHVVSPSGEVVAGFFYRGDALDYALEQVSR